ncbi:glutamine synthetase family protein [Halorientalis salina]|uniref:glutamine synthetase family protein n=1 Tax=Halorientalis salina TaxID=2932266 RepID=UPI0010AD6ACB|nr:glutamine synthetase family protein [Halorientalis salina]
MTDENNGTRLEARIESADVDHVFVEFPDVNGISRSKQIRTEYFLDNWESGFPMNLLLLVQTPRSEVPEDSGFGEEIDFGDGTVHPDPSTFRVLPWNDNAASVIADFTYEGEPVSAAPRTALKSVLDEIEREFGHQLYLGSELEFYLLDETESGYEPASDNKHECVTLEMEALAPFYDQLSAHADELGIDLTLFHHEHGPGQLEVLFDYGSPLSQVDTTFRFKRLVKRTARARGQRATFMAKPFGDHEGSGYHLHVSAFDEENLFEADDGEALSETGRNFVGGLIEHADALAALGTPTLNAFKRFKPEGFAPYTACWGDDDRTASIRVPSGTTRVENRIPSADANPYLVAAATLAAGYDGIRRELDPGPPSQEAAEDGDLLPQSPRHALAALEADETMTDLLGADLIRGYVASKRRELQSFSETVTEWERTQYVGTL